MEMHLICKTWWSFRLLDHGKSVKRLVIPSVIYHPLNPSELGRCSLGRRAAEDDAHKSGNGKGI
jgi:hypothetical protein